MMTLKKFAERYRLKVRRHPDDDTEVIWGRKGECHIYDHEDGVHLGICYMPLRRGEQVKSTMGLIRKWGFIKKRLQEVGAAIVQNGDYEGLALFVPENKEQAKLAIKVATVRQKRIMSEAQKASLKRAQDRSPLMRKRHEGV